MIRKLKLLKKSLIYLAEVKQEYEMKMEASFVSKAFCSAELCYSKRVLYFFPFVKVNTTPLTEPGGEELRIEEGEYGLAGRWSR